MIKFKLTYDKDHETEWLNNLAAQGWAFKSFFAGFYFFEPCQNGEYAYQVDFSERFFRVSESYKEFMEDAGVEILQVWGPWIVLRKPAADGEFVLYSDVESCIEHYSKIKKLFKVLTIIEIICTIIELIAATQGFTPGYFFCGLFSFIVIVFINTVIKTGRIIDELKERKGEIITHKRNRAVSIFLAFGLLLNLFTLYGDLGSLETVVQGAACALMIVGIVKTFLLWGKS